MVTGLGLMVVGTLFSGAASARGSIRRSPGLSRGGIHMLPGSAGRVIRKNVEPGTLILVRNGLPDWGLPEDEQFIGWADPDLSEEGQMQVRSAARLLVESGYTVDTVHTSCMKRSIRTVWIVLHELERIYLPVTKDWRLGARRCGALTGLSANFIAEKYGAEYALQLRTDLQLRPPPVNEAEFADAAYSALRERSFPHLRDDEVLESESLGEALSRCEPAWKSIAQELAQGKNVLVVGHQLSLSALVGQIEGLNAEESTRMINFPRGCPLIYKFAKKDGRLAVLDPPESARKVARARSAAFAAAEESSAGGGEAPRVVPAFAEFLADPERMLSREQMPLRDSPTCITSGAYGTELCAVTFDDDDVKYESTDPGGDSEAEWESGETELNTVTASSARNGSPAQILDPAAAAAASKTRKARGGREQVVVIIRHGKTEHNKLGLFTGWEDVPLAAEGAAEAMAAGRLLAQHGFKFDIVYTSWLSRSIATAWLVLEQLDALWLPIVKSWRLNERMYGALTSLSKRMIRTKYGETQFKQWRRGFSTRPPPVSSFSPLYPGNDERYVTYVTDVRNSVRETIIRSIEAGRLELHPKLPKSESLKDCMERTIPYWSDVIVPQSIKEGKSVLISSSENAIRGLMMHLCNIPSEQIVGVEIPTGKRAGGGTTVSTAPQCLRLSRAPRLRISDGRAEPRAEFASDPACFLS